MTNSGPKNIDIYLKKILPIFWVIQEEGGIEYVDKTDVAKGGGLEKC